MQFKKLLLILLDAIALLVKFLKCIYLFHILPNTWHFLSLLIGMWWYYNIVVLI